MECNTTFFPQHFSISWCFWGNIKSFAEFFSSLLKRKFTEFEDFIFLRNFKRFSIAKLKNSTKREKLWRVLYLCNSVFDCTSKYMKKKKVSLRLLMNFERFAGTRLKKIYFRFKPDEENLKKKSFNSLQATNLVKKSLSWSERRMSQIELRNFHEFYSTFYNFFGAYNWHSFVCVSHHRQSP